jgi:septal ring factor EnvC (AmiA/AmiB activator)
MKNWMMGLGVLAMLAGCDSSKPELESTRSTLASVTKERDDLKNQLSTLQHQLDETKAELAKAKTPPPPQATAAKTPAAPAKAKPAHKS